MPMKLKVELDFDTAKRAANKASKDIAEGFKTAMESALANKAFLGQRLRANEAVILKFQKDLANKQIALEERERVRKEKADNQTAAKLHALRTKYLEDEAAVQAETDEDRKTALKDQFAETKRLRDLYEEIEQSSERFNDNTQGIVRGLLASAKTTEKLTKRMEAAAEAADDIQKTFDNLSVQNLGENLTDVADKFGDALKNGIDLESMSKDLGKGIGKALGQGMKALGGGGAGMMAAAGAVAGAVAGLGLLLAAFVAVDKKVKEFNKDIIKTHGALSLMRMGGGNLNRSLQVIKHTVSDLSANFGVSETDAKALFDTLDKGGITLDRLTHGARDAADQQRVLNQALRDMHSIANVLGVGLSDYANDLTNYVNDLASSTQTVNDSFAQIAKMASESAFGTRRFYSMVTQATTGQAALNVSLEQTGDLLLRMSKIMGAKKAVEALGAAAGDMGALSAQDRIKHVILGGARGRRRVGVEARQQASTLAGDVTRAGNEGMKNALTQALTSAGLTDKGISEAVNARDPTRLVNALGKLNQSQQTRLVAHLRDQGTDEANALARRLDQQVSLSRAAGGSLSATVNAMETFSAGGSIAYKLDEVENLLGGRLENLNATQRAAAENLTGMSGHQYDAMRDYSRALQGSFGILESHMGENVEANAELDKHLVKMYGATIRDGKIVSAHLDANGNVARETGEEITRANDLSQAYTRATGDDITKLREETTSIAYQTMDATTSVADILENKVAMYIQRLYEWADGWLGPLLARLLEGSEREAFEQKRATATVFEKEIEKLQKQNETERTQMARLSVTATSSTNSEERARANQELQQLQQRQTRRTQQIQGYREATQRVREGNTYDTRNVAVQYDDKQSQREEAQVRGPRGEGGAGAFAAGRSTSGQTIKRTMNFASHEEAQAYIRAHPEQKARIIGETQISAADALRRVQERMGMTAEERAGVAAPAAGAAPAAAPTTPTAPTPARPTPTAPTTTTAAPTATPTPARPAPTAPAAPATPAQQARDPGAVATQDAADEQRQRDDRDRRERQRTEQQRQRDAERLLKGKDLGDGLATSRLPDAIAEADAKMRLTEALFKEGKSEDDIARILRGENLSDTDRAGTESGNLVKSLGLRRSQVHQAQEDFIYQNRGGQSIVTPISSQDSVIGAKPGGALSNLAGRAGGAGNVNIHINGGDERRVFEVVKRAIQQAGITPNRVPAGGT